MNDDKPVVDGREQRSNWAAEARALVRSAMTATLATLDREDGTPYASLVAVGTMPDGSPLLLLSRLALHTRNALDDPRASLLLDRRDGEMDALNGPRATLMGSLRPTTDPLARSRYLARHPGAAMYADFTDFAFYELSVSRAHFVGGFGRITPLAATELLDQTADARALAEVEAGVLAHMNHDHADAVALMARVLGNAIGGDWRLAGIDPTGCDLVGGNRGVRIAFPYRVTTADEIRQVFIALVGKARQG